MKIAELIYKIEVELTKHTRKVIYFELDSIIFFKMIKLIQFCIRDDKKEPYRNVEIDPKLKRFEVTINGKVFKVKRR